MQNNIQPTEPKNYAADGSVEVHSIFKTIQGEGPFAGTPAVFVRLAGCNIRCPSCDTDYTSRRQRRTPERVLCAVNTEAGDDPLRRFVRLVVITGGEPFRQNLGPLVLLLVKNNYKVQIETNGLIYDPLFPYGIATIVCSPKTAAISHELAMRAAAFKYVLQSGHMGSDGLPERTLGHVSQRLARPPYGAGWNGEVFIQPLDEHDTAANAVNLHACLTSSFTFGHRLCLQLHKLIDLP